MSDPKNFNRNYIDDPENKKIPPRILALLFYRMAESRRYSNDLVENNYYKLLGSGAEHHFNTRPAETVKKKKIRKNDFSVITQTLLQNNASCFNENSFTQQTCFKDKCEIDNEDNVTEPVNNQEPVFSEPRINFINRLPDFFNKQAFALETIQQKLKQAAMLHIPAFLNFEAK